ncbi:unnamed protein product [Closterium sp. NIES-53]
MLLQSASPLPGPSPYSGPTRGLTERREPESRPASVESRPESPVRAVCTGRRVPRQRPPPVPGTHLMTLRPSIAPQRVPLPSPPASSLPNSLDPETETLRVASPTVTHFLATANTDPSFESTDAFALVAELVDFAAACRLDYAACTSRGDRRTPFFEGCSPIPLLPSVASAAAVDLVGTEEVGAASAPSGRRRNSKGKGSKGGGGDGGGSGGGGGGGGGDGGGGGGGAGSGGFSGGGGGGGGSSGGGGGSSSGGGGGGGGGASRGAVAQRGGFGGSQCQSGGVGPCTYVLCTGGRRGETCGLPHIVQRCFGRLTDAWRAQFPDAVELPRWGDLLRQNVTILDLDFDAILAAMYAVLRVTATCYGESALSGTAPTEALHTFTLDSDASRSFFRDSTTLTSLSRPVAVSLADPSGGLVLAHSSTVLPCPAAPTGLLSGLHLPSFSTNLVSGADLQDAWVASSGQVFSAASRSIQASAPCSCRPLSHETLFWHQLLGHPSLPHLRGMASRTLVSGLPRSLPPLPLGPAPTCVPCVEGRQRATPHSSTFPPTEAPLQTLHMDVWGPARVRGQGHERYFLPVVDDYSRYTTVFPLRSKGETEVQNGIAERRIGMVMDVARTSMIHAAAPHFLWPFAVQYAAHQINLQPRVSLPKTTPTVRWTGKVGDASVFRVWGSRAFFHDTSADKLSSRAVPCVFLGFPPDAPGWQFYHPTSRRTLPSRLRREPLSPQQLREWYVRCSQGAAGAAGAARAGGAAGATGGAAGAGSARGAAGAGVAGGATGGTGAVRGPAGVGAGGGAGAVGPGGARTGGTGATGAGGAAGVGAVGAGAVATGGASGAGAAGGIGAGGAVAVVAGVHGVEGTCAVSAVSGGAALPRPYYVPLLQQVLSLPPSPGPTPPLLSPQLVHSQSQLQPTSPLPGPSPYSGPTRGLTERREPESRPVSPESRPASPESRSALLVCTVHAGRRVSCPRPPSVPGTHSMTLRPSTTPLRVPLPSPPGSSLPDGPDPESDSLRAASPSVTDPLFESTAASALVAELVDFATACRLDFATSLVAESASICPPSVGGECALGTDVLEDLQEDFECIAAAVPHLVSMLLAPEGDPDAPDIPTPRSYAEAIEGTYVDEAPPPGANIVSGMWIFRGVDFFKTFSPTPKMTTLRVLLHVAAQSDYELHSLDFSTAFLQGSLHEEIWLRRPPGFTWLFPPGTQWSLWRPVYSLHQAPREWHDTLRTALAALGFSLSTADLSLFLCTDTTLSPFYVLVYVDDLVFATADTEALAHVKSELQK